MPVLSDLNNVSTVQRPAFTMNLPFTPTALGFALVSCLQNRATSTNDIKIVPYTDPQSVLYFALETAYGVYAGRNAIGCVVKKVNISIPPAGADGGEPTLSVDCIGYSSAQITGALTGTATPDTAAPCQSTDWNITHGTTGALAAIGFCGLDFSIDNGLEVDPQVGVNPLAYELGALSITGSLNAVVSTTATDEYTIINTAAVNGYEKEIQINWGAAGATAYIRLPIMWDEPGDPEKQGNIMTFKAGFESYHRDADEPELFVAGMASPLTLWA
jgi:hypothetical protein